MNQKVVSVVGIVGLILIIFIVLGFSKRDNMPPTNTTNIPDKTTVTNTPPPAEPLSQPTPPPLATNGLPGGINAEDKATLLGFKGDKATNEEQAAYHELLLRLVVKTDKIQIGPSCEGMPFIIQVDSNKTITISNSDSVPHKLKFYTAEITIPANGAMTVKEKDFGHGEGLGAYMCDASGNPEDHAAGMIQIGEFK